MASSDLNVAIIGAGPSGLALALALHQQSIKCSIYETRDAPENVGATIMLLPNGLKVLEGLGLRKSLQKQGFNFDQAYFQDAESGRVLETINFGSIEKYGTQATRMYRYQVLEEMLAAAKEKSIPIQYGRQFDHVVSEAANEVTWQFSDGTTESASLLVGADGIHSTVRRYLAPEAIPKFSSMAAIIAAVPTAQLQLPAQELAHLDASTNKHPLPGGIIVPGAGAFVIMPQGLAGEEVTITVQRPMTEAAEKRWEDVNADKAFLIDQMRQNVDRFPPVVQNAVSTIAPNSVNIWPFYQVPRLDHWTSAGTPGGHGRVLVLGDAAHALPPSAGQGINQAFEDAYILARVLGRLCASPTGPPSNALLEKALSEWQKFRQARVDRVSELNRQMDLRRMPKAQQASAALSTEEVEKMDLSVMYDWLFNVDFEKAVEECLREAGA